MPTTTVEGRDERGVVNRVKGRADVTNVPKQIEVNQERPNELGDSPYGPWMIAKKN